LTLLLLKVALSSLGVGIVALTLLPTVWSEWWVGALLTNFRVHLVLLGALTILGGLLAGSLPLVAAGATALIINGLVIGETARALAATGDPRAAWAEGPTIRVMTFNLLYSNRDLPALRRCLTETEPDLLLVQEADAFWRGALATLDGRYPYRLDLERAGRYFGSHGVMLLSRYPLREAAQHPLGGLPDRLGAARIDVSGQPVWVASVHMIKPTSEARLEAQRRQLLDLAAWVEGREAPLIIGGDFNATLSMPTLQRFVGATGLTPDQRVRSWWTVLGGTFPASLAVFGLKIDHIMVRHLRIQRTTRLRCAGSDHLPVLADLEMGPPRSPDRTKADS
jgi:endonuclease/exonuclease/phosphatase (EEP) superfamily protein YafD